MDFAPRIQLSRVIKRHRAEATNLQQGSLVQVEFDFKRGLHLQGGASGRTVGLG